TFNVTDSSGNINNYVWYFNISDTTAPINPNGSRVSTSKSTTTATIAVGDVDTSDTIRGINESVNATISYGTTFETLGSRAHETDFNQSQSVSLSSLSASTTYFFNVSVCDYVGNCAQNGTFNFTTSAAAASAAAAAADSGGGGGGGAAAVSTVTDSKAQVWQSIPSGSSVTLEVDKSAIAVTSVAVNDIKSDLSGVELEVAALSENPVTTEAATKVYQYFRISKKNIADADAGSFKVDFRVTKAWLTENGLASGDVALYRFVSSEWNELATKVSGTDDTYVNYEADTPGFSSFAIGTKSGVKVEEEAPAGEEAAEEEKEAAPPEAVKVPEPVKAPGKAPVAWIIAAIVIILGIALIVAYQKQKKKA
ncbi:MAG: PGF-pre-PGF domain-containing protein, partial [Nanoarchaeota archaeon]